MPDDLIDEPVREETLDTLKRISRGIDHLNSEPPAASAADVAEMKDALITLAYRAPMALAALKSIQIAAWVIAAASVLHLFR